MPGLVTRPSGAPRGGVSWTVQCPGDGWPSCGQTSTANGPLAADGAHWRPLAAVDGNLFKTHSWNGPRMSLRLNGLR
jgi:hypothetical protein